MCVSVRGALVLRAGGKQLPNTIKTSSVFSSESIHSYLRLEAPGGTADTFHRSPEWPVVLVGELPGAQPLPCLGSHRVTPSPRAAVPPKALGTQPTGLWGPQVPSLDDHPLLTRPNGSA